MHSRSKTYESNVIDSERPIHTYAQFNVFHFKGKYKQTGEKNLRKSSSFTFQQHYIDTKAHKKTATCLQREQQRVSVCNHRASTLSKVQEFGSMKVIL